MLTWELVGAVVGAGLASGREIAAFFAQYGLWGNAGIFLAVGVLIFLADVQLPMTWQSRWPELLWKFLLSSLMIATGGAMLSGAGEVAALILPIHNAYWVGILVTLLIAWLLARKTAKGLAWVSRLLLVVLTFMIGVGLFIPRKDAANLSEYHAAQALLRGVTYGGFNAALQVPLMAKDAHHPVNRRKSAVRRAGLIILCLLVLGTLVLQRHPALLSEPMPFLKMVSSYGQMGFCIGVLSLYLAILSTLTACLRGLNGTWLPLLGISGVALMGFTGVVDWLYPLLGGACFAMLLAAKFTNCSSSPFHSRRDML